MQNNTFLGQNISLRFNVKYLQTETEFELPLVTPAKQSRRECQEGAIPAWQVKFISIQYMG